VAASHVSLHAFQQAWIALMERKTQTWLSILGVCVGVAAVICLSMIAENGRRQIFAEFETYGLNTIWIYRHWEDQVPGSTTRQGSGINNEHFELLAKGCCPSIERASPTVYLSDWKRQLQYANSFTKSAVQGVGEDFLSLNRDKIIAGRGFHRRDITSRHMAAVIGPKTAEQLFGSATGAIGRHLRVDGHRYNVIGVLANKDRSILEALGATQGYDINNRMLVPYTSYQSILGSKDIHTLLVEAKSEKLIHQAVNEVTNMLMRSTGNRFQYQSETMEGWIGTAEEILGVVTLIGISAAMISLLVGGIGIFNTMSTSVTERTREIGIRKAIGARNSDILRQFLFESLVVGSLGSLLGLFTSALFALAVYVLVGLLFIPSWIYVVMSMVLAIGIATIAGLRPARRASHMLPADALRFD